MEDQVAHKFCVGNAQFVSVVILRHSLWYSFWRQVGGVHEPAFSADSFCMPKIKRDPKSLVPRAFADWSHLPLF